MSDLSQYPMTSQRLSWIAALKLLTELKVNEMKKPHDGFERLQAELPQVQFIESRK